MALASAAGVLLKPQTPLQQLLEDINFQRTKEMRQLLKDDSGFVVLQGTTYWTDLFVRHFLFQSEPVHTIDSDDLLFFVRKKHVKSSSRHMPKYETEVEVFRKDSRKLPIGDPDVDWEETVYLNMVIHQFDYTLTLAICTRTSPKELQVLRRHSQRVYASPSRRKMDTKGEGEEITYPHICFMVDNFDEVFSDILVRDGEMVCVELVANDKDGSVQGVIFLGSIRYDALKKVYDARQSSLSSKVAQRMSFGLFSSGATVQTRCEFVRMKGPQGKGHAEMAVTKPKGSGVETPTSEPGFCATDMWDEWEEENDDYCTYRHQRRLSDPSANLNNFTRYGWRMKGSAADVPGAGGSGGSAGAKARSENEGLDSLASEVSEIEAGDLRDDRHPALSASAAHLHAHAQPDSAASPGEVGTSPEAAVVPVVEPPPGGDHDSTTASGVEIADAVEVTTPTANVGKSRPAEPSTAASNATTKTTTATTPNGGGKSTGCTNCFGGRVSRAGQDKKAKRRWTAGGRKRDDTPEMSEVYCPKCDRGNGTGGGGDDDDDLDTSNASPDCLNKMPDKRTRPKHRTILSVESELVVSKRAGLKLGEKKPLTRSASLGPTDRKTTKPKPERALSPNNRKDKLKLKDKDKLKDKEVVKKDKISATAKATNLLAKVSPKRMRANKTADKPVAPVKVTKEQQQKQKEQLKEKENKQNANHESPKTGLASKKTTAKETKAPLATVEDVLDSKSEEYELADDATSLNGTEFAAANCGEPKMALLSASQTKLLISVRGREELPVVEQPHVGVGVALNCTKSSMMTASTLVPAPVNECHSLEDSSASTPTQTEAALNTSLAGTESLLASMVVVGMPSPHSDCNGNECADLELQQPSTPSKEAANTAATISPTPSVTFRLVEGAGHTADTDEEGAGGGGGAAAAAGKKSAAQQAFFKKALTLVPKRRTPDGTNIYYWCDLPRKALKELDDGAYNPLWASRGFTQSFHFWKENRRQQSTPLNAFLTYVTLPWWSIAKDLLDHRETPILTF